MLVVAASRAPLYLQVQDDLRARIGAGEFPVGGLLPPEDQLCRLYGVSRITVRHAIDRLCADLMLRRKQGIGTFVAHSGGALQSVRLRGYLEDVLALDDALGFKLLRSGAVELSAREAERLGRQAGAAAQQARVVVTLEREPFMVGEVLFPADVVPRLRAADFASREQPTLRILRRAGIQVARGEQVIEAASVRGEDASILNVPPGSPVIAVERIYRDGSDRPVALVSGRYHPERYRLHADLAPRDRGSRIAPRASRPRARPARAPT